MGDIYNTKYTRAIDMLNQAHTRTHTCTHARTHAHTHTAISAMLEKRWDLSVVLKDETELENLIFLESVFQSVGAKKEKERSL